MNRNDLIEKLKKNFDIRELVCPHCYEQFGDKSWQFLTYVVDIELTKGKDKPIYKITKVKKTLPQNIKDKKIRIENSILINFFYSSNNFLVARL